jgi:hypothetical protein
VEREKLFAKDGLEKQDKDEEAIHDGLPFLPIQKETISIDYKYVSPLRVN